MDHQNNRTTLWNYGNKNTYSDVCERLGFVSATALVMAQTTERVPSKAVKIVPAKTGTIRPPFKKILFPVQLPGVYITADWELFFFILPHKQFFGQNFIIFLPKKKEKKRKKDVAAARLATISATC